MQPTPIKPVGGNSHDEAAHLCLPFVEIEGVLNSRHIPLPSRRSSFESKPWLYRAGDLSRITPRGIEKLHELGIRTIFDLRADTDLPQFYKPTPALDGIRIVETPLLPQIDGNSRAFDLRKVYAEHFEDEQGAFMRSYTRVLEHGRCGFARILRHLITRDEDEAILFHCNAGKDRTGVLAALLLLLSGQEDSVIIEDYALTAIGVKPFARTFMETIRQDPAFQENPEGAMNMFSSRPKTMENFLKLIRTKYGGAEAYVLSVVGLSQDELDTLKVRLVA